MNIWNQDCSQPQDSLPAPLTLSASKEQHGVRFQFLSSEAARDN